MDAKSKEALFFRRAVRGGERNIRKLSNPQLIRFYRAAIGHIATRRLGAKPVEQQYLDAVPAFETEMKQRNLSLVDFL